MQGQHVRMGLSCADALLRAGKQISDIGRWTQGACARNATGREVEPSARKAVRWSAYGIIYWVHDIDPTDFDSPKLAKVGEDSSCLDICAGRLFRLNLSQVNDQLGHEKTLAVFRAGILRARGRELEQNEMEQASDKFALTGGHAQ